MVHAFLLYLWTISIFLTAADATLSALRGRDTATRRGSVLEGGNANEGALSPPRNLENEEFVMDAFPYAHRALQQSQCDVSTSELTYFEITIHFEPQDEIVACQTADTILLGHDINLLLWHHGIGAAGDHDVALYLADVCPEPMSSDIRRQLDAVQQTGLIYEGQGGCRYCIPDKTNSELASVSYDEYLSKAVGSAIITELVPRYDSCLGKDVVVNVDISPIDDTRPGVTKDGNCEYPELQFLPTASLAHVLLNPRTAHCETCVTIDFSTTGDGKALENGEWVKDEWKVRYGVEFVTGPNSDGEIPFDSCRIFDTSDSIGSNVNLGSPNQDCAMQGPGKGAGGVPGAEGENCIPVGNVLIIQDELDKNAVKDSQHGGKILMKFDEPVMFSDIGLMDIDDVDQELIFQYATGEKESLTYRGFGDNSVQRVIANKGDVVSVEVVFLGEGAITEINFCPPCFQNE